MCWDKIIQAVVLQRGTPCWRSGRAMAPSLSIWRKLRAGSWRWRDRFQPDPHTGGNPEDYDNVTVINEDILKVDAKVLAEEWDNGRPANQGRRPTCPITSPPRLLWGFLESRVPIENITVMVQKQRCRARARKKTTVLPVLAVQYYAEPYYRGRRAAATAFISQTSVGLAADSAARHESAVEVRMRSRRSPYLGGIF